MTAINLKGIVLEDFVNYKKPSMFLITSKCDWKCCVEAGNQICQNSNLTKVNSKHYLVQVLFDAYSKNDITKSIVFGGLEPMLQFNEIYYFIKFFRDNECDDDIVIYTGYNRDEIEDKVKILQEFPNIIIKFGRFIPDQEPYFDAVLGVNLASDNQYAEVIS